MKKILFTISCIGVLFISCEPYEDFTGDFDYSIVYFATQKPLRTIVAYEEMQFKVGVAMGGQRENNNDEFADFVIDPTLLETVDGADAFTLLPESYYTLSNNDRMIISQGRFIGDVTVTLNRDLFINDEAATSNTYALPLRITNTSLDSIASGGLDVDGNPDSSRPPRDYTVLVVKYINPFKSVYFHRGTQTRINEDGEVALVDENDNIVDDPSLGSPDIRTYDEVWDINAVYNGSVSSLTTPGIGAFVNTSFGIDINESNNTAILNSPSSVITDLSGTVAYDAATATLQLEYTFTLSSNKTYRVVETLIKTPAEQNLRFEEW